MNKELLPTPPELAVLALIAESPRHGYEIERLIEARGMRAWTEIGFSSIYAALNKLEKAGWVASQLEKSAGRGPARRVYHITTAGSAVCSAACLELLGAPRPQPNPFLLGLAHLPALPPDAALQALRRRRAALIEHSAALRQTCEAQMPLPPHVVAMFTHTLTLLQAEVESLDHLISTLLED